MNGKSVRKFTRKEIVIRSFNFSQAKNTIQSAAEIKGFQTMIGCMSATSLGIAPAILIAQRAKIIDLDAPLYLFNDRPSPLKYNGSIVFPPSPELWG